jgi:hypothetical protein
MIDDFMKKRDGHDIRGRLIETAALRPSGLESS